MRDHDLPECIECRSEEVVVHTHEVAASGTTGRTFVASYECVECGRQWQPSTEVTGHTIRPIRRYS